eukprot:3975804-Pleurochrysis_carterae.AAC.10
MELDAVGPAQLWRRVGALESKLWGAGARSLEDAPRPEHEHHDHDQSDKDREDQEGTTLTAKAKGVADCLGLLAHCANAHGEWVPICLTWDA